MSGPTQGGTSITIQGENLGKNYAEIRNGIRIINDNGINVENVDCVVDESRPHNPFMVICRTTETRKGSGRVRLDLSSTNRLFTLSGSPFSFFVSVMKQSVAV